MGQQEVYDFLKANPKEWFTTKEIAKGINVSRGSVTSILKRLRKTEFINYRPLATVRWGFEYKYNKDTIYE